MVVHARLPLVRPALRARSASGVVGLQGACPGQGALRLAGRQQRPARGLGLRGAGGLTQAAQASTAVVPLPPKGLDTDTSTATATDICEELVRMTEELGVCSVLGAPEGTASLLVKEVERRMPANPYHNFRHIYDVAQFLFTLLARSGLANQARQREEGAILDPLEVSALWCSCLCHDLEHPGHTNVLEEALGGPIHASHVAAKRSSAATPSSFTLEWYHYEVAHKLLFDEIGITRELEPAEASRFEALLRKVIEATDMARHFEFYGSFQGSINSHAEGGAGDEAEEGPGGSESRKFQSQLMQWLMKCADLANTVRPPTCRALWEDSAFEEFHLEGDVLLARGLTAEGELPALHDRREGKREEASETFFQSFALPTFSLLEEYMTSTPQLNPEMAKECVALLKARASMAVKDREQPGRRKGGATLMSVGFLALFLLLKWPAPGFASPSLRGASYSVGGPLAPAFAVYGMIPPFWGVICAGLLVFPLITLWEVQRGSLSKRLVKPGQEAVRSAMAISPLAAMELGTDLVAFIVGERDGLGPVRRNTIGSPEDAEAHKSFLVGDGRLSRSNVRKKTATRARRMSCPDEAMRSDIWDIERQSKGSEPALSGPEDQPEEEEAAVSKKASEESLVSKKASEASRADSEAPAEEAAVSKAASEASQAQCEAAAGQPAASQAQPVAPLEQPSEKASCLTRMAASMRANVSVLMLCGVMVGMSVVNKVLFRLVLCSVGRYVHALSTTTNCAYIVYSWTIVSVKWVLGAETQRMELRSMLSFARTNWRLFASIGVCESVAFTLMPLGARGLPKALVPVIAQVTLPMSMAMNACLFKKKYTIVQGLGIMLIITGIVTATAADPAPPTQDSHSLSDLVVPLFVTALAYFFLVLSLILKDVAFIVSANAGMKLDIFLLEGLAGIGQGVALFLQWPMNFALLTQSSPLEYLKAVVEGFTSSAGLMPALIFLYWASNILYRLATLRALQQLSSLTTLLANVLTVPLSALAFCLPLGLPLVGPPDRMSTLLVFGTLVVCVGLMTYNSGWQCRR